LSSHSRCGLYDETMELFKVMRIKGVEVSGEAVAVVLSVCANMDGIQRGKEIHGFVIKGGYEDYLFVKNALIGIYGKKCEDLVDAHKIFSDKRTRV
jgi:pentatricopeptide repeat protein